MTAPVYGTDYNLLKKLKLQIAKESTPGTAATSGFKNLHALSLELVPQFDTEVESPRGSRFNTTQLLKREWAQATIGGKPDFNEMHMIMNSLLLNAAASGSATAYTRVWEMANTAGSSETRDYFTVQQGDDYLCETFAGGLMADYQLTFDREAGVSHSGNMMLSAMDIETALVSGAVDVDNAPMQGRYCDVWVADTPAGLSSAGNKVLLPWQLVWGISGRAADYWALNSDYNGPAFYEEGEDQGYTGSLKVPTLYGLPAFIENIRQGERIYTRVRVTGNLLTTGVYEQLTIDQCWFVTNIPTDNYKNVYAKNIALVGAQSDDATWTNSCKVTLINGVADA